MKRYWLFCGDNYYPLGGMRDLKGYFDSSDEAALAAVKIAIENNYAHEDAAECFANQWSHIFDSLEGKVILESDRASGAMVSATEDSAKLTSRLPTNGHKN